MAVLPSEIVVKIADLEEMKELLQAADEVGRAGRRFKVTGKADALFVALKRLEGALNDLGSDEPTQTSGSDSGGRSGTGCPFC